MTNLEAIQRLAEEHRAECGDWPDEERLCPCGDTVVLVCTRCEEPIFMATAPGTWCEHAAEIAEVYDTGDPT